MRVLKWILSLLPCHVISDRERTTIYMKRYTVLWTPWLRLYLHNILRDDDARDMHDHPWNFTSLILIGGYVEHTPNGQFIRRPLNVIRHKAHDFHRIELLRQYRTLDKRSDSSVPAWTLVLCGRKRREWGFMTDMGWVYWEDYVGANS